MFKATLNLAAVMLALVTSVTNAFASDPPAQSVEKLRALLSSIDPYLPKEAVSGKLVVYGSGSMDGLMHAWAENFTDFHSKASFEISGLPEDKATAKLLAEPSTIWMVSRPISSDELAQLKAKGLKNPVALEVAKEALGVFVHQTNPVKTITGEQLRNTFTAQNPEAPTWKLLGATGTWADKPINLIRRGEDSGTQKFLTNVLFATKMRPGQDVESNSAVVAKIKDDPQSIGICGLRCGSTTARPLQLKSGDTTIPSDDLAILSGKYPLVRPMSIVFDLGSANKNTNEFVHYILSQSGQSETVLAGLFPIDLPLLRAELQTINAPQKR
ncbi:MAG: substrate-binding domain-containing protein [Pirellulales bacterium]